MSHGHLGRACGGTAILAVSSAFAGRAASITDCPGWHGERNYVRPVTACDSLSVDGDSEMVRRVPLLALALLSALGAVSLAGQFNKTLSIGDRAPDWNNLEGTDGK